MLSENKFTKYLIYAVGEIVLVVIGILIALQINNWNEDRKRVDSKHQLMEALKKELLTNQRTLNDYMVALNTCNSRFNKVLLHSAGEYEIPLDSLKLNLSTMVYTRILSVANSVQEEAINSGKFELLSDTLKRNLSILKDFTKTRNTVIEKGFSVYNFSNDKESEELLSRLHMMPEAPDDFPDHPSIPMHPDLMLDKLQLSTLVKDPNTYLRLKSIYLTYISDEIWVKYGLLRLTNETIELIDNELKEQ